MYGEIRHYNPVLEPTDLVSTATNTKHLKVTGHKVHFLVYFAEITGDSLVITVEESSAAATTGAEAIPFKYRVSGDTTSDTWGAITTADSGGLGIDSDVEDKLYMIEVDPSDLSDGDNYLSVLLSPEASCSAVVVSAIAVTEPRYRGLNMQSST